MEDNKYFKDFKNSQYEEYNEGIFNYGEHVKARYIKQIEETFQGNELIEALPPERNMEQCFEGLYRPPLFSKIEREDNEYNRIQAVFRLLNYVTPLTKNFEIEKNLSVVLRHGYVSKKIKSPRFIKELRKYSDLLTTEYIKDDTELKCICDSTASSSTGFSVFGISGAGKTTAIINSLSYYPQVIKHTGTKEERFLFIQVTWIKIDCTYNGDLKGLCQKFFQEMDRILNADYMRKYGSTRNSVDRMIIAMAHLSLKHALGVLVIDEIQHLTGNVRSENFLNYFVTMMNEVKLPVIYIGTYKAYKSILAKDFRHARRATGIGVIRWDRLSNDEEWNMFIGDLWQYQWTKKVTILTEEIKELMYKKTGGITDRIIKLFITSQVEAIKSGKEMITANIIKRISKENFMLTDDMIDALEKGDIKRLSQYEDLYSFDISKIMDSAKQIKIKEDDVKEIYESDLKGKLDKKIELKNRLQISLSKFGYEPSKIKEAIDISVKKYGITKEEPFLLKEVCKILINGEDDVNIKINKQQNKKTRKIEKEEHDEFLKNNIKNDFEV